MVSRKVNVEEMKQVMYLWRVTRMHEGNILIIGNEISKKRKS